ncbi:hypothetical protein EV175_001804, partial [Coemansia sp. RSA 1933]
MARDSKGAWIAKNSHRITNKADHNRRSFVVKILHGNAPVIFRQGDWYPDAYLDGEMLLSPTTLAEIAKKWNANAALVVQRHVLTVPPTILNLSRMAARQGKILGPQAKKASTQQQFLEQIEFSYFRWKECNELQISREEESGFTSRRRRQIMKQPYIRRSSDNRTAVVPPIPRPWGDDDFRDSPS